MNDLVKIIVMVILFFSSIACTTLDSREGRSEYKQLQQWHNHLHQTMADQSAMHFTQAESQQEMVKKINQTLLKKFSEARQRANALDIRHAEVKKLRDLYLEMLTLSEQALPAFVAQNNMSMEQMEVLHTKMDLLNVETYKLEDRLTQKFGS